MLLDLRNNETFQNVFLICFAVAVIVFFIAWYVLKRKGIKVYSRKIQLLLIFGIMIPIILLPIWLHPLGSIQAKIKTTAIAVIVGFASFYAIDRLGKKFRKFTGIENEEDRHDRKVMKEKKKKDEAVKP